jgi:hypothetical protein
MTERVKLKNDIDLTGMQFERLLVLERTDDIIDNNGRHNAAWLCECQCENKTIIPVRHHHLISGNTKSCGCLNSERVIEFNKLTKNKKNTYDLTGEYGVGWTTNTNEEFYFDLEDYDKIKDYCWTTHVIHDNYKALETTNYFSDERIWYRMQWIIMGDKGYDHKNRNPLDNRKDNLRKANNRENAMNHNLRKDNTSGVIGVNWDSRINKWIARICIEKNKRIVVYRGVIFEDAVKARLKAEKHYYGEFAPQQHLYEQYGII